MGAFFSAAVGPVPAVLLIVLAVVCAITDLWKGRIYNVVTLPAIAVGFVVQIALHGLPGLWIALGGFAVAFFPAFLLFALGGMGGGDVKLLGAIGTLAGAVAATEALILAFLIGTFIGLAKLAWEGRLFASLWRVVRVFAGFLIPGVGRPPPQDPADQPKIRFGFAISLGTLVALWDLRAGGLYHWVMG